MKNQWDMTRRALGLAGLIATVAAGSAHAAPVAQTSACSAPTYPLSQPYLGSHDANWYTLAPGERVDEFTATGWTLTGGAQIVTTTLADGTTGTVLDLPAGSKAVSPPMCVDSDYPSARVDVREVSGPPTVKVYVAYTNTPSWETPSAAGAVPGSSTWSASPPIQLHAGNLWGWQDAQYTFEGGNKGSDSELYDFWVDPHSRS
jgi:hypothetical protein